MVKVQDVRDGRIKEVTPAVANVLVKLGRCRILEDAAPAPAPTPSVSIEPAPVAPVVLPDPEPAPAVVEAVAYAAATPEPATPESAVYETKVETVEESPAEPRKKRKYTRRDLSAEG